MTVPNSIKTLLMDEDVGAALTPVPQSGLEQSRASLDSVISPIQVSGLL